MSPKSKIPSDPEDRALQRMTMDYPADIVGQPSDPTKTVEGTKGLRPPPRT